MKRPKYIQLYLDYADHLRLLSEAQVGRLMLALFTYAQEGTEPDFQDDQALTITFSFLRREIDREFGSYQKMCERNRRNVTKRYESKQNEDEDEDENENEDENEHSPGARASHTPGEAPAEKPAPIERREAAPEDDAEVTALFGEICTELPPVSRLTAKRRAGIKKASPYLDGEGFRGLFRRVAASDFLCGRSGSWKADFDWILRPANLTRILEGSFDNRASPQGSSPSYCLDELEQLNPLDDWAL